ncbi:MAG TPA: mechanosensitive ion channel family protein [Dyadobacter sp.]|jgi:MscS family membrane protein|nr:mechanosensitive ion channel family protein [Dyadobacter sp.]
MRDLKKKNFTSFHILIVCLILILTQSPSSAQIPLLSGDTTKTQRPVYPPDSLGRRSPRGAIDGFIKASYQSNYQKAALYLYRGPGESKRQGVRQAKALQAVMEVNGRIYPYSWISNDPDGKTDDNLGPDLDRIGAVTIDNESFDLILQRFTAKDGSPIWLFSAQTLDRIPMDVEDLEFSSLISSVSPLFLQTKKWGGVPAAHWIAMVLLLVVSYFIAFGIARLFIFLIPRVYKKAGEQPYFGVMRAFSIPAQLYLAITLFSYFGREVGISLVVRQSFSNLTLLVNIVAVILLIWQLIDVIGILTEKRMTRNRNQSAVSAILFLRRALKIALIVVGVIVVLDTLGFDVTTGIAALGIGGIALALGTQKTVENFVGSVTIIADQPVRVGDFCKIGEILGTVERIGMRATQVRTLDRTIVTIPNGELSSLKIENYAYRERFWFHPAFFLRPETSPEQIRQVIQDLKRVLLTHPRVNPDPARVRFTEVGFNGVKIDIFAYVDTGDMNSFLEIQEELLLKMMDAVKDCGTRFMLPSQTLYMGKDNGMPVKSGPVISSDSVE